MTVVVLLVVCAALFGWVPRVGTDIGAVVWVLSSVAAMIWRGGLKKTYPDAVPVKSASHPSTNGSTDLAALGASLNAIDLGLPFTRQIEVSGETYHMDAIRAVFDVFSQPITASGTTLDQVPVILVPEPSNVYDPNAVAVMVVNQHIGYLPTEIAQHYAPVLAPFVRKGQGVGCWCRIWAKDDGGIIRARATLLSPDPEAIRSKL